MDVEDNAVFGSGSSTKVTRRRLVQGSAAVGAAVLGCGRIRRVSAEPKAPAAVAAPVRQGGGSMTIAILDDDLPKAQPLIDEYQAAHNITVNAHGLPYQTLLEQLTISLAQGSGDYDAVSMDDPWMPLFAGGGFLRNLDELMVRQGLQRDADFVPELLALGDFPTGTGLRGIPWIGNVQVFAHRSDVLRELNLSVPATWDEVLANARVIADARASAGLFGFALRGQPTNPAATSFLPVLRGHGVDVFQSNEVFEPQLETDQAMAAMRVHLELAKLAPPGVENVGHEELSANMYTGRAAQSGDVWPNQLLQIYDDKLSDVVGLVDVGPEPAQAGVAPASMTGNWLWGIPQGSKNAERGLDFIAWMTAPEQQRRLLLEQNIPATRTSVLEDPEAIARLPFLPGLLNAARTSVPRPRTQFYIGVEEILGRYVAQAIIGETSGEDALSDANSEIRDLMMREGELTG